MSRYIVWEPFLYFLSQVLVCAPSNIAVDQLTEKIHKTGLKVALSMCISHLGCSVDLVSLLCRWFDCQLRVEKLLIQKWHFWHCIIKSRAAMTRKYSAVTGIERMRT